MAETDRIAVERHAETERELLEMLYADGHYITASVAEALAAGITNESFWVEEHLYLWRLARLSPNTTIARRAALYASATGTITGLDVPWLLRRWFRTAPPVTEVARRLLGMGTR